MRDAVRAGSGDDPVIRRAGGMAESAVGEDDRDVPGSGGLQPGPGALDEVVIDIDGDDTAVRSGEAGQEGGVVAGARADLEIGEAVKALPDDLLATQPTIPWRQIARMRDHLAHRYFDTTHAILQATVDKDLPDLERAIAALAHSLPQDDPDADPSATMTRRTSS